MSPDDPSVALREAASEIDGPVRFLEFFAGAGLARTGLGDGWSCSWANDNLEFKKRIYEHRFGPDSLDERDVEDVAQSLAEDPELLEAFHEADLAWASYPCQDLSLAGFRLGMSAGRSGAFWAFWHSIRVAVETGHAPPPVLVLENVVGLLHSRDFRGLCASLAALGLDFGAVVVNASEFIPQSRPRVFVIAVPGSLKTEGLELPKPTSATARHPQVLLKAFDNLDSELKSHWRWWHVAPAKQPQSLESVLVDTPSKWDPPERTARILELMTPEHRSRLSLQPSGPDRITGFVYRRMRSGEQRAELRTDGIAGCLVTPRGGSSRVTIVEANADGIRSRLPEPVELCRLMGLDEAASEVFPEGLPYNQAYHAMGDGVAVPVVRHLRDSLLANLVSARRSLVVDRRAESDSTPRTEHSMFLTEADGLRDAWLTGSGRIASSQRYLGEDRTARTA